MKKTIYLSVLFILAFTPINAQVIKGKLVSYEDSLLVKFVTVAMLDSNGIVFAGTGSNYKACFIIQLPDSANALKIVSSEYADLKIINLTNAFADTIDLGEVPMVKVPPVLNVSFKGISARKERRWQKQIRKKYNRKLKKFDDVNIEFNNRIIRLKATTHKQKNSDRLKLVYLLDFEDVILQLKQR